MLTVAILGVLAAMAGTSFVGFQERARRTQVVVDIKSISTEVDGFEVSVGRLPVDLNEVGLAGMTDIWGNPYRYQPVPGAKVGQLRKDKFLVPINSDYDLYSMGPDGKSTPALTAQSSRDDVIRAGNGSYIGVAENY
jgi:general secretion pathway protein G